MGIIHFLNVKDGDCSIIQHLSGRISMIDICNGNSVKKQISESVTDYRRLQGNRNQKNHPVNPIDYLHGLGVRRIWRFILTHPDMDHMDGVKRLFKEFDVKNFWDTENNKEMKDDGFGNYNEEDWMFYQKIRREERVLHLYDGSRGQYYNADNEKHTGVGDCLQILCPTKALVKEVNKNGDYNNCSQIILYNEAGRKILFCGDAEEKEWDVLLDNHEEDLRDVDILLAPHHGRKSGGNDSFLDILKPKLTLFGNAKSKDLNYDDWNNRGLEHFTNNQGGTFILKHEADKINIYCTYSRFAKDYTNQNGGRTDFVCEYNAWYLKTI